MNKTIRSALLAALPFSLTILGCSGQDVASTEDPGDEIIESTILRSDADGNQTVEVTTTAPAVTEATLSRDVR